MQLKYAKRIIEGRDSALWGLAKLAISTFRRTIREQVIIQSYNQMTENFLLIIYFSLVDVYVWKHRLVLLGMW